MKSVNIHEAKTHLSRLLERVSEGEEIIIAKAGKPIAKLGPYRPEPAPRTPGYWRGKVEIRDGFEALPDEVAAAFRGDGS